MVDKMLSCLGGARRHLALYPIY